MEPSIKQHEFIQLRAMGISFSKISEKIGVSKPTLISWSKEFEVEINNEKAILLDDLREQYTHSKEAKTNFLKLISDKVEEEVRSRNFKDVSTEKLIKLMMEADKELERHLQFELIKEDDFVLPTLNSRVKWKA